MRSATAAASAVECKQKARWHSKAKSTFAWLSSPLVSGLVSGAATTFLSAPVDPSVPFLGVDISSCILAALDFVSSHCKCCWSAAHIDSSDSTALWRRRYSKASDIYQPLQSFPCQGEILASNAAPLLLVCWKAAVFHHRMRCQKHKQGPCRIPAMPGKIWKRMAAASGGRPAKMRHDVPGVIM